MIQAVIALQFRNDIPFYTDQLTEVRDLNFFFILRVLVLIMR